LLPLVEEPLGAAVARRGNLVGRYTPYTHAESASDQSAAEDVAILRGSLKARVGEEDYIGPARSFEQCSRTPQARREKVLEAPGAREEAFVARRLDAAENAIEP
jgi:hypothetical protein